MRKKALLLITCAAFLFISGCSSSNQLTETMSNAPGNTPASAETEAPASTETPAPEETTLSLGTKGTVGDWNIKVTKASVKQKIKNGSYRYFKAGKGNSFVVISMSAENSGKKEAQFLPRFGIQGKAVVAKLLYQDEYEYSATELIGYDKDLATQVIDPLKKEKGIIVFEVPKETGKSKKDLTLRFSVGDESVTYSLK